MLRNFAEFEAYEQSERDRQRKALEAHFRRSHPQHVTGRQLLEAACWFGGVFMLGVLLVLRYVWLVRFPWEAK